MAEKVQLGVALEICGCFGKYQILLLLKLFLAAVTGVLCVNSISIISLGLICDFKGNKVDTTILFVAVYIGMVLGGFIWGIVVDSIGRRKTLLILLSFTALCEGAGAFTTSFIQLFSTKFFTGFICSGIFTTNFTYTNEFVSAKSKDSVALMTGMISSSGYLIQPVMAFLILPLKLEWFYLGSMNFNSWRLFILADAAFPFLAFFVLLFTMPESPAFLLKQKKEEEALIILRKIYEVNTKKPADTFPVTSVYLDETTSDKNGDEEKQNFLYRLFTIIGRPHGIVFFTVLSSQIITMASFASIRAHFTLLIKVALEMTHAKDSVTVQNSTVKEAFCSFLHHNTSVFSNTPKCTRSREMSGNEYLVYLSLVLIGLSVLLAFIPVTFAVKKVGKVIAFLAAHTIAALCLIMIPFITGIYVIILLGVFAMSLQNCITISVGLIISRVPTNIRGFTVNLILIGGRLGIIGGSFLISGLSDINCYIAFCTVTFLNLLAWPLMLIYKSQPDVMRKKEMKMIREITMLMPPSTTTEPHKTSTVEL